MNNHRKVSVEVYFHLMKVKALHNLLKLISDEILHKSL